MKALSPDDIEDFRDGETITYLWIDTKIKIK